MSNTAVKNESPVLEHGAFGSCDQLSSPVNRDDTPYVPPTQGEVADFLNRLRYLRLRLKIQIAEIDSSGLLVKTGWASIDSVLVDLFHAGIVLDDLLGEAAQS